MPYSVEKKPSACDDGDNKPDRYVHTDDPASKITPYLPVALESAHVTNLKGSRRGRNVQMEAYTFPSRTIRNAKQCWVVEYREFQ